MRWLVALSTICLIAGIVLAIAGNLLFGALLIVLGLLGEAASFVVSEALRLRNAARDWIALFAEGRPR